MTSDTSLIEVLERHYYYPFGMAMEGVWSRRTAPGMGYLYNGKELEEDLGLGWYAYGFRYYDATIGRFTGVDPISDQFPWVSTFNYAENEPVGHIDLHGLQKYTPKMQSIDKPSDLLSTKMLNNLWEGTKTAAIEIGYRLGNWNPSQGTPNSSAYEDENYTHKGSGVEFFSDTPLNANGTQALPGAKNGATAVFSEDEISALKPGEAGGIIYDAARKVSTSANLLINFGLAIENGKDAVNMAKNEMNPKEGQDSVSIIRWRFSPEGQGTSSDRYVKDTLKIPMSEYKKDEN
jgi:RHS repeat-associated protein